MDEIRINHNVELRSKQGFRLYGIVLDFISDRVAVQILPEFVELAQKVKELEMLYVCVNTHLGIKNMKSYVISELNKNNCIIIENNETIVVQQKREFVRVASTIEFKIKKSDNSLIDCKCINISAGGVAFTSKKGGFEVNDYVEVILPKLFFDKDIHIKARILKVNEDNFVAQYTNLNVYDEDKIVKYVFKLVARK